MEHGERILLVDDEADFLFSAAVALKAAGFRVAAAATAEGALERLSRAEREGETFDLVVTDMLMPGMSGVELVKAIRERDSRIKFIVMTGDFDQRLESDLRTKGCRGQIVKPFPPAEFVRRIRAALDPDPEPVAESG